MLSFGEVLTSLRKGAGLTQQALAKRLGLSRSTIGMYEKNEREPNFHPRRAIAALFEVDVNTLYGTSGQTGELAALLQERPLLRELLFVLVQLDDEQLQDVLTRLPPLPPEL